VFFPVAKALFSATQNGRWWCQFCEVLPCCRLRNRVAYRLCQWTPFPPRMDQQTPGGPNPQQQQYHGQHQSNQLPQPQQQQQQQYQSHVSVGQHMMMAMPPGLPQQGVQMMMQPPPHLLQQAQPMMPVPGQMIQTPQGWVQVISGPQPMPMLPQFIPQPHPHAQPRQPQPQMVMVHSGNTPEGLPMFTEVSPLPMVASDRFENSRSSSVSSFSGRASGSSSARGRGLPRRPPSSRASSTGSSGSYDPNSICKHFLQDRCTRKSRCKFSHDLAKADEDTLKAYLAQQHRGSLSSSSGRAGGSSSDMSKRSSFTTTPTQALDRSIGAPSHT
jgi:hypothetical protein